jgi:hypothetical protein
VVQPSFPLLGFFDTPYLDGVLTLPIISLLCGF